MGSRDVRVLPSAHEEIDETVAWLAGRSPDAARSFLAGYRSKLELLASGTLEYPLSHLPELARLGYRACGFGSYVMLYYVEKDAAVVAHVFHQHRNYGRLVAPIEKTS